MVIFVIDGFLLHPIPPPEGTFSPDHRPAAEFDLSKAGTPYSNSDIIDEYGVSDGHIYLVRQEDELHLLYFHEHTYTKRSVLKKICPLTREQHRLTGWVES